MRYRKIHISADQISALSRTPKKVYDWGNTKNPQWFWLLYVQNGRLNVEKWDCVEAHIKQDDRIFAEDNNFHPEAAWEFDAIPGELRVFENRKAFFYSEMLNELLKATGAGKLYGKIPKVYYGLEICNKGGKNRVHADLYVIRKGKNEFEKIQRENQSWGRYELEIPEDTEILVVDYKNTTRKTDSISCHYHSLIRLQQLTSKIKALVQGLN